MNPITLSIIALSVTTVNAIFSIFNVIVSRTRLLAVKEIQYHSCHHIAAPHVYENIFTVSAVSWGAVIWDLSARIEIKIPLTKPFIEKDMFGHYYIQLYPIGDAKSLNARQGIQFEYKSSTNTTAPNQMQPLLLITSRLATLGHLIPKRNISICVYSGKSDSSRDISESGTLIRRIRSRRAHFAIDMLLNNALKTKPTLWNHFSSWRDMRRHDRNTRKIKRIRDAMKMAKGENTT